MCVDVNELFHYVCKVVPWHHKEWAGTLDRPEDRFGIYLGTAEAILMRKDMEKRGVIPALSPTSRP